MMDLQGTELLFVLSACGTGLGMVSAGEGVYGLRRAFQNARARTIISTLFKVPDKESTRMIKKVLRGTEGGQGKNWSPCTKLEGEDMLNRQVTGMPQRAARFVVSLSFAGIIVLAGFSYTFAQSFLGSATKTVNLREGPGTEYRVLRQLKAGAQIFIISRDSTNDFLNVIDIETNTEGWVYQNFVEIKASVPKSSDRIFTPEGPSDSLNPELQIHNNTSLTMTLTLNNKSYVLDPQEKKTLTLTAGIYECRASAPGVIPYYGQDRLDTNSRYSWQFYIETRYTAGGRVGSRRKGQ